MEVGSGREQGGCRLVEEVRRRGGEGFRDWRVRRERDFQGGACRLEMGGGRGSREELSGNEGRSHNYPDDVEKSKEGRKGREEGGKVVDLVVEEVVRGPVPVKSN